MKSRHYLSIFIITLLLSSIMFSQTRKKIELSENWTFKKGESKNAEKINFNDKNWQTVTVPHDWAIYGPFDKEIDKQVVAITQNGEKERSSSKCCCNTQTIKNSKRHGRKCN